MSKLDNLQKKLDMWQRTATMYGSINVTLTPSDVVQLHQDVAVLYARIAELEAESERFTVHSEIGRQDNKSPNDTQTQTIVYGKESEE
jgi:hypothetical protein